MAEDPYTGPPLMRSGRRYTPRHLDEDFPRGWSYWFGYTWKQLKWKLETLPSVVAFVAGLFIGLGLFS